MVVVSNLASAVIAFALLSFVLSFNILRCVTAFGIALASASLPTMDACNLRVGFRPFPNIFVETFSVCFSPFTEVFESLFFVRGVIRAGAFAYFLYIGFLVCAN